MRETKKNPKYIYVEHTVEVDPMEYIDKIETTDLVEELAIRENAFEGLSRADKIEIVFQLSNGFGDRVNTLDIDRVEALLERLESRDFWYD